MGGDRLVIGPGGEGAAPWIGEALTDLREAWTGALDRLLSS